MYRLNYAAAFAALSLPGVISLLGCGDANRSTGPAVVSAVAARVEGAGAARPVSVLDACDPTTFNAVIGPGTCTRPGGVRFADFIAELTRSGVAGAWRFAPSQTTVVPGQTLVATNRGGEAHTFTPVAAFGGGIVPALNALSHNPVRAPECNPATLEFLAPGATSHQEISGSGIVRFQCCIHPWMRLTARVGG